ncbi:MAG: chorismate-binding protein [Muribaculaceae bacterium]|nr:chorismate-binding protein [Muribaculaceae bacterium]
MGIRYDRDSRRATNGPMFFFSIVKDETFAEQIRSAFLSGLSFYAYRYPEDHMLCYGSSEGYIKGIGTPGFTIGLFSPEKPYITIPYHYQPGLKNSLGNISFYNFPHVSTSFEEYKDEVSHIIESLKKGDGSKVVAARVIVENNPIDIAEEFYSLCQRFPKGFIFCFGTPATGCWIGASPELLLESKNGLISSMSLAGTRQIGTDEPWDDKNIEEQKIVTDYISEIFNRNGLKPEISEPYTKEAGSIEHICTEIRGIRDKELGMKDKCWLEKLLRELSPTPALCGYPKQFALKEIDKYEKFDRGCYGGFCGPFRSSDDFHFNVVLRCAALTQKSHCIYVGGGITSKSDVSKEWRETEIKYRSIK